MSTVRLLHGKILVIEGIVNERASHSHQKVVEQNERDEWMDGQRRMVMAQRMEHRCSFIYQSISLMHKTIAVRGKRWRCSICNPGNHFSPFIIDNTVTEFIGILCLLTHIRLSWHKLKHLRKKKYSIS